MRRSISMQSKKGFTLIELVVVLAVLAIIMAIAVPMFTGVREQAKVDSDMATMASIAKLAEFEYVRQDLEAKDVKELTSPTVQKLVEDNFADEEFFQSADLKTKKAEDIDIAFSDKGKVASIDIDGVSYSYANGKVTPPPPTP